MMKKIAIIGPESTGKSTLSTQLAEHFGTVWCPEFARIYLLQNGIKYTYENLLPIAKGQKALIEETIGTAKNNLCFIDTEMFVMKVWCEVVFNNCHTWILKEAARQHYDLFLLCTPDIPWTEDVLREYPDLEMRQKLFKIYKDICINSGARWAEINGNHEQRLLQGIRAVEAALGM
jgi:NadR type nicotinamide-nucleotide adenylyltransferase